MESKVFKAPAPGELVVVDLAVTNVWGPAPGYGSNLRIVKLDHTMRYLTGLLVDDSVPTDAETNRATGAFPKFERRRLAKVLTRLGQLYVALNGCYQDAALENLPRD
jgi:hypothetical protein